MSDNIKLLSLLRMFTRACAAGWAFVARGVGEKTPITLDELVDKYDITKTPQQYDCADTLICNELVNLPSPRCTIVKARFVNVRFTASSDGHCEFRESHLTKCTLEGKAAGGHTPSLTLNTCDIEKTAIIGDWNAINIDGTRKISGLQCHGSCGHFSASSGEWISADVDSNIRKASLNSVRFIKGSWLPCIEMALTCANVTFDRTRVDMSTLINKCHDVSAVNIQTAKVIDKWGTLRNQYTGSQLLIVILFTLIFFVPYVFKTVAYVYLAKAVTSTEGFIGFDKQPLWEILLYSDYVGWKRWIYATLAGTLIVYNVARFLLTIWLSRLREREDHRKLYGFSNVRPPDNTWSFWIGWLAHIILMGVVWVALASALWRVGEAMLIMVPRW